MKDDLKLRLIQIVKKEVDAAKISLQSIHDTANSSELKSEGKYDTRATQLKYLRDGQSKRLAELQAELLTLQKWKILNSSTCSIGSLIYTTQINYFIIPITSRGVIKGFKTISNKSPIFHQLSGLGLGDEFKLPNSGKNVQITKIE